MQSHTRPITDEGKEKRAVELANNALKLVASGRTEVHHVCTKPTPVADCAPLGRFSGPARSSLLSATKHQSKGGLPGDTVARIYTHFTKAMCSIYSRRRRPGWKGCPRLSGRRGKDSSRCCRGLSSAGVKGQEHW